MPHNTCIPEAVLQAYPIFRWKYVVNINMYCVLCFNWLGRPDFKSTSGCRRQNYRVTFNKLGFVFLRRQLYYRSSFQAPYFHCLSAKLHWKWTISKLQYFSTFIPIYVMDTNERSRAWLLDCGRVRKGIPPQMLLCHTSTQVRRPVLILEIKKPSNTKVSHWLSQGIETLNERDFYVTVFLKLKAKHTWIPVRSRL